MIVPVLALLLSGPGVIGKGSGLYSDCKAYISFMEQTGPRKDYEEVFSAGRCIGYVKGVAEGVKALKGACPVDATTITMIRVYLFFMESNPKLFDEAEPIGLSYALHDAYPCPAK